MYLVVQQLLPYKEQVTTLQNWQDSCVEADQVVGAKHAVTRLREAGHPEAEVLCVKKLRANGVMVEVDGIALANGCAIIVENKTKLTAEYAASLAVKVSAIRAMVEAEHSSSAPLGKLKGKQLLPVLCGRTVTSNTTNLNKMADICQKHQIECWDVSGSGVELSRAGCFKSPYLHPFGKDRKSTIADAAAHKAATRTGATESSGLRCLSHFNYSNTLQRFAPRGHVTLGQPLHRRLF